MHSPETAALADMLERAQLPPTMLDTIREVHLPLASHIAETRRERTPLVVGICGPQGSGKSTMASMLAMLLAHRGRKVAAISLDDFYLSRGERELLATRLHPLLITRGVPGTHDAALAMRTLDALRGPGVVEIPVFDKATDERKPASDWMRVHAPVDIVLFEGWCVGARPQPEDALAEPINDLERENDPEGRWRRYANERLGNEYALLFERIDLQILLQAPSFDVVYGWRAEQELKLRKRLEQEGADMARSMDAEALQRFVAHYERIARHIATEMPSRADVLIALDRHRRATCVFAAARSTP